MKQKILFVDDDAFLLQGLKRLLRKQRDCWDMDFTESSKLAVEWVQKNDYDVVCTDMRMPEMNGEELLFHVRRLSPQSIRLVLSGQCDDESIFRTIGPAHQFLGKPCNCQQLIQTIHEAIQIKDRITQPEMRNLLDVHASRFDFDEPSLQLIRFLQQDKTTLQELENAFANCTGAFELAKHFVDDCQEAHSFAELFSQLGLERSKMMIITSIVFDTIRFSDGTNLEQEFIQAIRSGWQAHDSASADAVQGNPVAAVELAAALQSVGQTFLTQWSHQEHSDCESFGKVDATELTAALLSHWGFASNVISIVLNLPHRDSIEREKMTGIARAI